MRCAHIKKASQDEQWNQTTTKKISYIKNFMLFQKQHLITKSKKSQIKLILGKIIFKSPEKIWDYSIKKFGNN